MEAITMGATITVATIMAGATTIMETMTITGIIMEEVIITSILPCDSNYQINNLKLSWHRIIKIYHVSARPP